MTISRSGSSGFGAAALALVTILAAAAPASSASAAPRNAASQRSSALAPGEHEVVLRGVKLWYRVAGKRGGGRAPVVFLAGGPGGNSYTFAQIPGPWLERDQLMVYFDQRGTGRSERPASRDYAISTLVDDIEALRIHLGVPKIAIIAHSFGAIQGLEYAAKYPSGTAALVVAGALWNAPLSCREQAERIRQLHSQAWQRIIAGGTPSDDEICEKVFRAFPGAERERFNEENMFPIASSLERLNRSEKESGLRNTGELSGAVFKAGLLQYRFTGGGRITAPVLVVGGGKDYAAGPRTQRALAAQVRRGRLLEYPSLGHWMFIDDPERFARDVSRFLRRNARRR